MIPRTFRFDKYQFHTEREVEKSSALESPRPVGKGEGGVLKRNHKQQVNRDAEGRSQNQYQDSPGLPQGWARPYFKKRNLWGPREDSGLFKNPTGVLVGFDGSSGGLIALGAAVDLARRYLCGLTVVQVVPEKGSSSFTNEQLERQLSAKLIRALENSVSSDYLKQYPPQVQLVANSDTAEALIQAAGRAGSSLIVVGKRRQDKHDATRLGSVACRLVDRSPCPVMVWPGERNALRVRQVVVPFEGTRFSYSPMAQAIFLCRALGAKLSLLHVSTDVVDQAEVHGNLTQMMEHLNWGDIPHELVTARGEVVGSILSFCRNRKMDMIVMGTHGHGMGDSAPEKSVTLRVMEESACPVFVVHPRA